MKPRFLAPLLALCLCLGGCARASSCGCASPGQRIHSLAATLYTLPDDFHQENYQEYLAATGPEGQGKAISARLSHNKARLHAADFAPGALDALTRYFAENDLYIEPYLLQQGASALCTSVESQLQEDGSWCFTAPVTITNADGIEAAFTITGTAQFDASGRFTDVQVTDDGGLGSLLESAWFLPVPR